MTRTRLQSARREVRSRKPQAGLEGYECPATPDATPAFRRVTAHSPPASAQLRRAIPAPANRVLAAKHPRAEMSGGFAAPSQSWSEAECRRSPQHLYEAQGFLGCSHILLRDMRIGVKSRTKEAGLRVRMSNRTLSRSIGTYGHVIHRHKRMVC